MHFLGRKRFCRSPARDAATRPFAARRRAMAAAFGCLFAGAAIGGQISWRSGPENTNRQNRDSLQSTINRLTDGAGSQHAVVKFSRPLAAVERQRVLAEGLVLLRYLGNQAYFATFDSSRIDAQRLVGLPWLDSVRPIDRARKLDPRVSSGTVPEFAVVSESAFGVRHVALYVLFHADVRLSTEATEIVLQNGARIRGRLESLNGLVIEIPESNIDALADEDAVQWIEWPLPALSGVNDGNRQITEVDQVQAAPYNLTGAGVTALVYDTGSARVSHVDFQGRLTVADGTELKNHSTHVACTLGGAGIGDATYKGMAPGVTLVSYGLEYGDPYIFLYNDPGDLEADYSEAIDVYAADIANNSIGSNIETNIFDCDVQGDYGVTSALIDAIVVGSLGTPFPIVWSAGNERQGDRCDIEGFGDYYSVSPPAGAKNSICVGAVNSNDDSMTTFSSWGPLDDGRLKPDIVAPGCQVGGDDGVTSCAAGTDTAYTTLCGTSMAAPTVTGSAALLLEDFRNQFAGQPDPINSTIKAILIHNAQDILDVGPDYRSGYGSIRTKRTVDFLRTGQFTEGQVDQGESSRTQFLVNPGDTELKITLVWDDAAGTPNVTPVLVNDLDLRVFDESGQRHFPWTLDPNNPALPAVRSGPDHLNNVEQVVVESPTPGTWRIEVRGFSVPQGPQSYSLCTSAPMMPCSSKGVVTIDADTYGCAALTGVRVVDCDLNTHPGTADTASVSVSSDSEPAGETVQLTETGPDTSEFFGSLSLDTIDGTGVLHVTSGDTMTATYIDADDGTGGQNVTVTATAAVDCTGPAYSNVHLEEIDTDRGVVVYQTDENATGTVHYGQQCDSLVSSSSEAGAPLSHAVWLTGLQADTQYFYRVESTDLAGNTTVDDNGGACYTFITRDVLFDFPLDTDPGWVTEGDWAFGQPTGGGSLDGDPVAGHTGVNVYGTNLNGDYTDNLATPVYLTTTAMDLSQRSGTELRYWRWLLAEPGDQDLASVEVSNNGIDWVPVWSNLNSIIYQPFWVPQRFDISAVADGQPQVYIRWGLGPTSPIIALPGWNIDDIQIVVDGQILPPECTDGTLNQDEQRIDCGGLCPPCECLDDVTCEDGQFCNGAGYCDAFGSCQPGIPIDCNDGVTCTSDSCNETTDMCDHAPDDSLCDDGDDCNGIEICDPASDCQPGNFVDCNANGILDSCDVQDCTGDPSCGDCNSNGFPDGCDIQGGLADIDGNGVPDICEAAPPLAPPPPYDWRKNRYISFLPNNHDIPVAFQVELETSLNHPDATGTTAWVDLPDAAGIAETTTAGPVTRLWSEPIIHVTSCFIAPVATYAVRATRNDGLILSPPLLIETAARPMAGKWWGDVVGSFDGTQWSPPQGFTNIDDALAAVRTWQGMTTAPHTSVADVEPQITNRIVNFSDVLMIIQAFKGQRYPFGCPGDPCQDTTIDPCP